MIARRGFLLAVGASMALSACTNTFRTFYKEGLSPSMTRGWHVSSVVVVVPRSLTVSEAQTYEPDAEIVWREDPPGDRYAQVQKIMQAALTKGVRGLRGPRAVRLEVTMSRFHALTFQAEAVNIDNVGVHNVDFTAKIVDARTGEVLVPPTFIDAALPALTGAPMAAARARGVTQKSMISAHVADTIAGWLGTGPDVRMTFSRIGR